jgi:PAT family beta-lactamase induction signal transducer AmpG
MTMRRFHQLDVFTAEALRGNPLAVVHGADGLSDAQMAAFARWTNLSETTFLLAPTDPAADYRVRIFTPGGELPFAGHPTLGSCHAWLAAGGVPHDSGAVVQQCGVGLVRVRRDGQRLAVVSATQDILVDAYRTDLLPEQERGAGAAATNLGYRGAMLAIGAGGFTLAGRYDWPFAFAAAALLMLMVLPFTLSAPSLPPIQHQVLSLRQAVVGPTREFLHRTGGGRAAMLLALVLFYRWPDGLLNAMAVPFLLQKGFSPEVVGSVLAGWGIGATIVGTIVGGILFGRLGINRSLWIFAIIGAFGNLAYWALATFPGGMTALLAAVGIENLGGGLVGAAFVALLMSLCNPRFSATQYALLSGIYALSRSVLSGQSGFLAEAVGWSSFFLLTAAASLPAFMLMFFLTPWHSSGAKGAFNPLRDPT